MTLDFTVICLLAARSMEFSSGFSAIDSLESIMLLSEFLQEVVLAEDR